MSIACCCKCLCCPCYTYCRCAVAPFCNDAASICSRIFSPGSRDVLTADEKAVLLVPGMVSNALEVLVPGECCCEAPTWKVAWLNPGQLIGNTTAKLKSLALELKADGSTTKGKGMEVRVVDGLKGISSLNVAGGAPIYLWHAIIEKLAPTYSTLSFNSDWRRWGDIAYAEEVRRNFVSQVEHAAFVTKLQVTLVCHSMGAQVVLYCLGKQGKAWSRKFIQNIIMCGPAIEGTPALFPSYACGPAASMFDFIPANVNKAVAKISSSWACMVAEFPAKVGGVSVYDDDYPFVNTPEKQYFSKDVGTFFDDTAAIGRASEHRNCLHFGSALWPGVLKMREAMTAPAVPTHIIYGRGQVTPTQWEYETADVTLVPKMKEGQPGDNTVVAPALERLGRAWKDAGLADVTFHVTPDKENHSSIIKCSFTLDVIQRVMREEAKPVSAPRKACCCLGWLFGR